MECVKEKKFLFWKWKVVVHKYKVWYISKFMNVSKDFELNYICENCNHSKKESFVEYDELLKMGFDSEKINKVNSLDWFYPSKNNL